MRKPRRSGARHLCSILIGAVAVLGLACHSGGFSSSRGHVIALPAPTSRPDGPLYGPEYPDPLPTPSESEERDGGPGIMEHAQWVPAIERELAPGQILQHELAVAAPGAAIGRVRWSGSDSIVRLTLEHDGMAPEVQQGFLVAAKRGMIPFSAKILSAGTISLEAENTSTTESIHVEVIMGTVAP